MHRKKFSVLFLFKFVPTNSKFLYFTLWNKLHQNSDNELVIRNRKIVWNLLAVFSWILTLACNFRGDLSDSASTFFKLASSDGSFLYGNDFSCRCNYNWLLDMWDNDNIMTVNAPEVVQKILTDEKHCHKCSYALKFSYSHNIFSRKDWMLITHIQRS